MEIKIASNIDHSLPDNVIEVVIHASENSLELQKIINSIQSIANHIDTIIGKNGNEVFIIPIQDIILFYSLEQTIYCKTKKGDFKINRKLYELEELIDKKQFIRISNSCIANINFIESFDLSYIGNIIVKFKNGDQEYVSKRRIPHVMKFLKEK